MLDEEGQGVLNDWDLAKHVPTPNEAEIVCGHECTVS